MLCFLSAREKEGLRPFQKLKLYFTKWEPRQREVHGVPYLTCTCRLWRGASEKLWRKKLRRAAKRLIAQGGTSFYAPEKWQALLGECGLSPEEPSRGIGAEELFFAVGRLLKQGGELPGGAAVLTRSITPLAERFLLLLSQYCRYLTVVTRDSQSAGYVRRMLVEEGLPMIATDHLPDAPAPRLALELDWEEPVRLERGCLCFSLTQGAAESSGKITRIYYQPPAEVVKALPEGVPEQLFWELIARESGEVRFQRPVAGYLCAGQTFPPKQIMRKLYLT